jgi:nicotinate-nucleotide adenylyltransferase
MALRVYYGGTFDPIHNGHLAIARAAHDALRVPIRLMPAADPPHRPAPGANARQRAEMLALATAAEPGLRVDLREFDRTGPSYSVDTLHALRAEYGADAPLALLVGADSFVALATWKAWRELFDLAHFVVAERPGSPLDGALPADLQDKVAARWAADAGALSDAPAGRVLRLRQPLHHESATAIRALVAAGGAWRARVPAPVADYIDRHGLYRDGRARAPSL